MISKKSALVAGLVFASLSSVSLAAQATPPPASSAPVRTQAPVPSHASATPAKPAASVPAAHSAPAPALAAESPAPAASETSPQITIATPAPAPAPWPVQDRISWAAGILLAVFGYVGIVLAISLLRKIERQQHANEIAIQSVAESTIAMLDYMKGEAETQRPWLLVTAEPEHGVPGSFTVLATNRGNSPARITSLSDGLAFVKEESQLPGAAIYKSGEPHTPTSALILVPGEAAVIKTIRREDISSICESPEQQERVENWDEKIYMIGTVKYTDLRSSSEGKTHETAWCCWYIHGRQKSGLVIAGPQEFHRHS